MTALDAVSTFIPPARVTIDDVIDQLQLDEHRIGAFRRFFGLREACIHPTGTFTDLMIAAAGNLDALRGCLPRVRYLIHARTIDGAEPDAVSSLQRVRSALGLDHAITFTVTEHACASGLLAVDIAGRLLAQDGDASGLVLVLTGEKALTPEARVIPGISIMGEGAAAVLVRHGGSTDRMLTYATHTLDRINRYPKVSDSAAQAFNDAYVDSLAEVILAVLRGAGIRLAELSLILPHNVNRISWIQLCKRLKYPLDQVLLNNVPILGHCFCADPFINFATALNLRILRRGDRYLMASVGLGTRGAIFSAMAFEH
jgi:3-oxoacyl-[acyl-carrier-protein] synthase-3